jgi:hypothetical protein
MDVQSIENFFDSKLFVAISGAAAGGVFTRILGYAQSRIRVVEYYVGHERVAMAAKDSIFGNVSVTWQGHEVDNLFMSTVTIVNTSGKDYSDIEFCVYTQEAKLLNQYTEIAGTSYNIEFTEKYNDFIKVGDGGEPTAEQFAKYHHRREFLIPVFNRGSRAVMRFLTTVPNNGNPVILVDSSKEGVSAKFMIDEQKILNAPANKSIGLGVFLSLLVMILVGFSQESTLVASIICVTFTVVSPIVGALFYKMYRSVKNILMS